MLGVGCMYINYFQKAPVCNKNQCELHEGIELEFSQTGSVLHVRQDIIMSGSPL
jgi:hypothetical protein